jgi:hypothetical protein
LVCVKLELLPEVEWDSRVKERNKLSGVYEQFDKVSYTYDGYKKYEKRGESNNITQGGQHKRMGWQTGT